MRRPTILAVLLALPLAACGKKGPPLPPFVRLPSAPADVKAERRGTAVDVQFVLPSANADGSRPANIQRVEVYALSGPAAASENVVMKDGVRIGSVDVKSPRDPNVTVDPDEPDSDIEALEGPGLDQGAVAHVRELLTAPMLVGGTAVARTYVGVGITTRGRRGLLSGAVAIPLSPAPPAPGQPAVTYDETVVTITWPEVEPGLAYAVYDVSPPPDAKPEDAAARAPERRVSTEPVTATTFADPRITWNVERCYTVRAVKLVDRLSVEGDAAPPRCVTLKDTFPPAAPSGVTAVASEGAISLIWTPSPSADLAGYRVLRAEAPATTPAAITSGLLSQTTYSDAARAGVRYTYAVQAVDSAGNVSEPSAPVEETAR